MANLGIHWEQTPEYLALTNRRIPPGGRTTYDASRNVSATATDFTSFVHGQAYITADNWPEFMYTLRPPPEWEALEHARKPKQKTDRNGQLMWEQWPRNNEQPRPLRDFPGLPDRIFTNEKWWWIEIWRRLHPQAKWADVLMRMECPNRTVLSDKRLQNKKQQFIHRKHSEYLMLAWFGTSKNVANNKRRDDVLATLRVFGINLLLNSTRGATPGLINPALPRTPDNVVPLPVSGRPQRPTTTSAQTNVQANMPSANPVAGESDEDEDVYEEDEEEEEEGEIDGTVTEAEPSPMSAADESLQTTGFKAINNIDTIYEGEEIVTNDDYEDAVAFNDEEDPHPADSEEETKLVMAGIRRSKPKPLAQHDFLPAVRKQKQKSLVCQMLGDAVRGGSGHPPFAASLSATSYLGNSTTNENPNGSRNPRRGLEPKHSTFSYRNPHPTGPSTLQPQERFSQHPHMQARQSLMGPPSQTPNLAHQHYRASRTLQGSSNTNVIDLEEYYPEPMDVDVLPED